MSINESDSRLHSRTEYLKDLNFGKKNSNLKILYNLFFLKKSNFSFEFCWLETYKNEICFRLKLIKMRKSSENEENEDGQQW